MNEFKAAVLCELGSPLEIKFISPNAPLKKGQVFVKLIFSGICRSQLMEQEGKKRSRQVAPPTFRT